MLAVPMASLLLPDSHGVAPRRSTGGAGAEDRTEGPRHFAFFVFKKSDAFIFQKADADVLRPTLFAEKHWL